MWSYQCPPHDSQLHPHVLGNRLRRVESGKACNEAEFCRILVDWFFNLDQQTVLSRLVSIFSSPFVSLHSDRKRLERESIESHCLADKTSELSGFWVTNGTECVIINTPGLNDSDNEDTEHIWGMVEFLRRRGWVHSIVPTQV